LDSKRKKQLKTLITIGKFAILLFIVVGIPFIVWLCFPNLIEKINTVDKINAILHHNQLASAFIYIGMQIAQVILFFSPGQLVQMAGGYAFPFPLALLLTFIGISLGTIVTFNMARLLGKDLIFLVFGERRSEKFVEMMHSKKAFVIIFLFYLFPGVPKDAFCYIAGISNLRVIPFTLLSMTARLPALVASLIFGDMFSNGNYNGMFIMAGIVLCVALICLIFRKKFTAFIDKMYVKSL